MPNTLTQTLFHELLPTVAAPLAQVVQISQAQATQAARLVMNMTVDAIVTTYHTHGLVAAEQLFRISALQNIARDQAMNAETVQLARDTGRPILDHIYTDEKQQVESINQLVQQCNVNAQQAQDILQAVTTLSLRELAILFHDDYIEGEDLASILRGQTLPYVSDVNNDVNDVAPVDLLVPTASIPVTNTAVLPPDAVPPTAADIVTATLATTSAVPEAAPVSAPEQAPSAQTQVQKKQASRWSQYALHGAFLVLILIPVLVFWRACSTVENTAIERNNQAPNTIDSGTNGSGSVIPKSGGSTLGSAPTSPAANEIVPNGGDAPTTPLPVGTPAPQ